VKKTIVFGVVFCLSANLALVSAEKENKCEKESYENIYQNIIVLESPMLGFIDGKSFGMNESTFGLLLQVRREVRKRLFGIPTQSGRVGIYTLNGKQYCLIELTKMESENEAEYYSKKSYLEKNRSKYTPAEYQSELAKIEEKYQKTKDSLAKILHEAKEDFLQLSAGYRDSAKGMKGPLLMLIQEFCDKKGLKDCFLLTWGETKEEEEDNNLRRKVQTFKVFTQFCEDLAGFLEAMARACPKAKGMFLEMVRSAKLQKEAQRANK